MTRSKLPYKTGTVFAVALGGIAILLTLSRAAWISFGVAFVALLLLSLVHPRARKRYVLARVAVAAAVVLTVIPFSGSVIQRLTRSDTGAVNIRYEYMQIAWSMIQDRPVLGFGLNTYVFNMPPYSKYRGPARTTEKFGHDWPVVHNIYLLTWVEQGTIGFLLFMGFHVHLFWIAGRNLRYYESDLLFNINLGAFAGIMAVMVDGLASFYIRNPCGRVFWIVAALIVAIDYWNRENAREIKSANTALTPRPAMLAATGD